MANGGRTWSHPWFETTVQVGETTYRVGVQIAEDADGEKLYNFNEDLTA